VAPAVEAVLFADVVFSGASTDPAADFPLAVLPAEEDPPPLAAPAPTAGNTGSSVAPLMPLPP
jgi:hypothetical protein